MRRRKRLKETYGVLQVGKIKLRRRKMLKETYNDLQVGK